jgi:hypothetical protein
MLEMTGLNSQGALMIQATAQCGITEWLLATRLRDADRIFFA